jgi:hypothetical protein
MAERNSCGGKRRERKEERRDGGMEGWREGGKEERRDGGMEGREGGKEEGEKRKVNEEDTKFKGKPVTSGQLGDCFIRGSQRSQA